MDSILTSIKKDLGIAEDYTHFDPDIITDINVAFSTLTQIGAGPETGFYISDKTSVWTDYMEEGTVLNLIKAYISKKVRMLFDPPLSSGVIESINSIIKELEWRIYVSSDCSIE